MARPTEVREDGVYMQCRCCGLMIIREGFFKRGIGRYSKDCQRCDPCPSAEPRPRKPTNMTSRQRDILSTVELQMRLLHTKAQEDEDNLGARPVTAELEELYWCEGPRGKSFPTVRKMTPGEAAKVYPVIPKTFKPKGNA